jgi:hypothetical protein
MTSRSDLLRVAPDDPEYLRLAAAEAEYWSGPVPFALESLEERFSEGPVDRYTNERFTGDRAVGWHETRPRMRTIHSCCMRSDIGGGVA